MLRRPMVLDTAMGTALGLGLGLGPGLIMAERA